LVAVQVGASEAIKAWRPEYFGRAMAALAQRVDATFVLIGTNSEGTAAAQALTAYRASGGRGAVIDAIGQTTLSQLVALLQQCRLMITNDTGPMHLAVGVGTPVIDLSVGHVDFHETGPYGNGHWVIQPELGCAPCGFDQVCAHHACKDRIVPDEVAQLCVHLLGHGPLPTRISGVRLYQSSMDGDGLVHYDLRAGHEDESTEWYARFWRRFWYESFTGLSSNQGQVGPPPDLDVEETRCRRLLTSAADLVTRAEAVANVVRQQPLPVKTLQSLQSELTERRHCAIAEAMGSPAFEPITVAFVRHLHSSEDMEIGAMARQQVDAYRTWYRRLMAVMDRLRACQGVSRRPVKLQMMQPMGSS